MLSEILATGDEILTGSVIDSNSAYIAQKLEEAGIEVVRHGCVGDDVEALASILKEISVRADLAVITGGLGPTSDDITAEAAARAAGVEPVFNREAMSCQAMMPEGAECLFNSVGTAPGFVLRIGRCIFFFLPGVPSEMRKMLANGVLPWIDKLQKGERSFSLVKTISTFGLAEASVNERLAGLTEKFPGIKLGLRARFPVIYVKLYVREKDKERAKILLEKASESVLNKIGEFAFSADGESMEAVVGSFLRREKVTIAVAESCTGGLISNLLTNVPGSSDYFLFSGVTYSNKAKIKVLGVSEATLNKYGAVHEETVKQMADGARRVASATYGVSTSGIAGPSGGTEEKPVGTVCIGIATPDSVEAYRFNFQLNERLRNKRIFAITALDLLRRKLLAF
ncbi:MAG: nicotinamide-nucleotide amidohydrolase family protein [Desulfobacteraceae bacterium]|nr:nicotinamide-nucleotide amidohydrolase family protein [Pseudomonadota bacterium]MCG2757870.1 nicotinamide-nucleotide amidohydrolase family protein [Desulfobacteraceae bacterium]